MTAAGLLTELGRLGVVLHREGSGLRVSAPPSIWTPVLREQTRQHKAELLALLTDLGGTNAATGALIELHTSQNSLGTLAAAVAAVKRVGLDLETTGLDPVGDRPRLLQLALPGGKIHVVDLFSSGGLGPLGEALCTATVVAHNAQFDLAFLHRHFDIVPAAVIDTMLMSRMVDGGRSWKKGAQGLAAVAGRHLGVELGKELQRSDWSGPLSGAQIEYAARDAAVLPRLADVLRGEVQGKNLTAIAELEHTLVPVVVAVELAGVRVDRDAWERLVVDHRRRAAELSDRLKKDLGVSNPNSSPQVLSALQRLGFSVERTSKAHLAPHRAAPAIADLIEYRRCNSFATAAGAGVLDALERSPDGRVRGSWNQLSAPTGRMSCSAPNLLGISKAEPVRECFVAEPGNVFINLDYGAIELRVLAEITNDPLLTEVLCNPDGDPHALTAAKVLGIDKPTKAQRNGAKAVNFGFCFGMGPPTFVLYALDTFNVVFTVAEATEFRRRYLATYAGVHRWQEHMRLMMPSEVRTLGGRVRYFSDDGSGYTERLNTPVQGTAADGFKQALVLLHPRLTRFAARIVLVVHDEILIEAPQQHAEEIERVAREAMIEGMTKYVRRVPVLVSGGIGRSWAEAGRRA